ncbi:MAG: ATP-binding cassette domain-containing protein [Chloroflexota bacterium]|nr:ATP-binding cassette domain-containing protein [Chloroflexota bacterium]
MADSQPIVEMKNIYKSFGAVRALRGVDLTLHRNEILGLVGDNAAGKSTLMKVLSGAYIPDEGEIFIDSQLADIKSPEDSRHMGIEMVYQDFMLANNLDVASNVFLGREMVRWQLGPLRFMNQRGMENEARALIDRLRIDIPSVRLKVENLSGGQRQAVAIGRATAFDAKVIIMDEPTAALSVAAIDKVVDLIGQLKGEGASIIVISHRLEDLFRVGDRVMIMRHGRKVGDLPVQGDIHTFREELVAYMIGARDDLNEGQPVPER